MEGLKKIEHAFYNGSRFHTPYDFVPYQKSPQRKTDNYHMLRTSRKVHCMRSNRQGFPRNLRQPGLVVQ